ncbi:MAG: hypothetical protein JKY34_07320 [Kordiimonadaceae bacterium]|nr:hypothetical protein [Kordiimonadaceae bacterium]
MSQISEIFGGDETELYLTTTLSGTVDITSLIGELDELSGLEEAVKMMEADTYGASLMTKKPGKHELSTATFKVLFKPSDTVHQQLQSNFDSKTLCHFSLVMRDGDENARCDFSGYIGKRAPDIPKDEFVKFEFEVMLTIRPVYDWTTDALI